MNLHFLISKITTWFKIQKVPKLVSWIISILKSLSPYRKQQISSVSYEYFRDCQFGNNVVKYFQLIKKISMWYNKKSNRFKNQTSQFQAFVLPQTRNGIIVQIT